MIHIQTSGKNPSKKWLDKAKMHTKKIKALSSLTKKKQYIDTIPNFWTDLRDYFEKYSNEKCWITEASEAVSYYDVDHFRPKKQVNKIDAKFGYSELVRANWMLGYWWLSYDWKNYRLMGQIPNRCFKRNYFPLEASSKIALKPSDKISTETPLLLDPTKKVDISLITFDINGKAIPVFSKSKDSWKNIRAVVSIELYGLNDDKLIKARMKNITRCSKIVSRANTRSINMKSSINKKTALYKEYQAVFSDCCVDLKELISEDADFSATARAYLRSFNYKWIEKYVIK